MALEAHPGRKCGSICFRCRGSLVLSPAVRQRTLHISQMPCSPLDQKQNSAQKRVAVKDGARKAEGAYIL